MRPANDHLTDEEILRVLFTRGCPEGDCRQKEVENHELEQHVGQCERCGQVSEEYRLFMSKLYEFGKAGDPNPRGPCPDPAIWAEVVTGLMAQDQALKHLNHAATCSACAQDLKHAYDAVGENTAVAPELQKYLHTASEEWQREFAEKVASGEAATIPGRITQPVPLPARPRGSALSFLFRPWAIAAVAAVVVAAAGVTIFTWLRGGSPDTLIRQAYVQQRTIEMRIPGAGYGPIRVERAGNKSLANSPRALLEAEVLIKSKLEKTPDDPDLLRQKAEADLLVWNYQPAIETLNHAARIRPGSFPLLIDLATAYFERAEAGSSPADYEAGLEYLGEAIRQEPSNPSALFNRAILYERLYFYDRAIADWEQLLKIEKDPGWRTEAEKRLQDLRARQQKRSTRHVPENLTLAQFEEDVGANRPAGIEEYFETLERKILPRISPNSAQDESYRVATVLANNLQYQHGDRFLTDLLLSSSHPGFHEASNLLSQGSSANHVGHYEEAGVFAAQAAARFRTLGNTAGLLAAQFEEAYALQFESKADPCRTLAAKAAAVAHRERYAALEVQLLLEQAICSNMSGDLGVAKELTQRALTVAKSHDYQSYYVRGLTLFAGLEDQAGDDSSAWAAVHEGLDLCWTLGLPPVRAYSLYSAVLEAMAERLGHVNVQFAAAFEALNSGFDNPSHVVEASERARLGDAALRLGNVQVAEEQFQQAAHIFASLPQTESVRWRRLEARINLARAQVLRGADTGQTAEALIASSTELGHLSNRYVEFQYYEALAELKMRAGDREAAKQFLESAIRVAETGTASLSTWRERMAWMSQHRQPYLLTTEMLLRSGQSENALNLWERYRTASAASFPEFSEPTRPGAVGDPRNSPEQQNTIITYAFSSGGLMIWIRHGREVQAVNSAVSPSALRRTAENFINECARPDSDIANLRADAQSLYAWLIQPVAQWLPPNGHLIVEPDGILGAVPFEALMDATAYLGTRYHITVASSVKASDRPEQPLPIPALHALVVAAPTLGDGSLEPPPGTLEEARRVATHFNQATVLVGRNATVSQVEKQLARTAAFHFAGHAALNRNGAAMLMADGKLGTDTARSLDAGRLAKLKLAVFSACGTARSGEMSESNSLVSEFLHAGTQNVVASRWNVDSVATADFIELFYNSVLSGHSVSDALQSAAGSFRSSRERAHPYYRAAFSAFGSA